MATPSYKIASELSERIYQFIADKKTIPWRQGWISRTYNPCTENRYRGINYFLTKMHMEYYKLQIPQFMTFTQIKNLGGSVKPGEKSVPIIFYKSFVRSDKDRDIDEKNEIVSDNAQHSLGHKPVTKGMRPSYFLRNYNIYGVEQTNLPAEIYDPKQERQEASPDHERLLKVIEDYCTREHIEVSYAGVRAYYDPRKDSINIPRIENFAKPEDFYHTLCHEIAHSTGHKDRLGRFKSSVDMETSRRDQYGFEESIADLTANLLMSQAGLVVDLPNSASYIEGWLKSWYDKKDQIYKAMKQAQKACDYICNSNSWGNDIPKEKEVVAGIV